MKALLHGHLFPNRWHFVREKYGAFLHVEGECSDGFVLLFGGYGDGYSNAAPAPTSLYWIYAA